MSEPTTSDTTTTLTVTDSHAGKRLDKFLVDAVPELSRARVKQMLDAGQVRVDGRRARKGDPVRAGSVVELLAPPPPRDFSPLPDPTVPLVVRHEDDDLVVLDKPARVATAPLSPDEKGTLANAIIARWPETREVGFRRSEPGLLHRLDTDTSGLVLVAKNAESFEALRKETREGRVEKRYLALVEGRVEGAGDVDFPLVPHRKDPKRVEAVTEHVRLRAGTKTHAAHTHYEVARAVGDYTLLEVSVRSAFRHQVSCHMATIGHPLVGDALYRGPSLPEELHLGRHFLHASELRFPHPRTGAELRVTSPLPDELAAVFHRMRERSEGTRA